MKFKFYLIKYVKWVPRCVRKDKTVVITAVDLGDARRIIYRDYEGWEVSMFWPV